MTIVRSEAVPAARFIAGEIISAACAALKPCLAKFKEASAASCIPKVEFDAAVFIAPSSIFASSEVLPIVFPTSFKVLSTSPKLLKEAAPSPTIGSVTPVVIFAPRSLMPLPIFSTLFHALTLAAVPLESVPIACLKLLVKLSKNLNSTSTCLAISTPPLFL